MPRIKRSPNDSLERRVIETPTLSRLDVGIVNEGFDSIPSPSFFYIDDSMSSSWIDHRHANQKRFTESWIELDRAYSCGSSSGDRRTKCCTRRGLSRCFVYLLLAFSVIGFAAIVSAILYMEVLHKMDYYEWHPLKANVFDERITHVHRPKTILANESLASSTFSTTNTTTTTSRPMPLESTASSLSTTATSHSTEANLAANISLPVFTSSQSPSPPAIPTSVSTPTTHMTTTAATTAITSRSPPSATTDATGNLSPEFNSTISSLLTSSLSSSAPSSGTRNETTDRVVESSTVTIRNDN